MSSMQSIKFEKSTLSFSHSSYTTKLTSTKNIFSIPNYYKTLDYEKKRLNLNATREEKKKTPISDLKTEKLLEDLTERWEKIENKGSVITFAFITIVSIWVATSVLVAFDSIPIFPKLFQLVGFIYTSWFIYRYLLFKSARGELIEDFNELKSKIFGEKDE